MAGTRDCDHTVIKGFGPENSRANHRNVSTFGRKNRRSI